MMTSYDTGILKSRHLNLVKHYPNLEKHGCQDRVTKETSSHMGNDKACWYLLQEKKSFQALCPPNRVGISMVRFKSTPNSRKKDTVEPPFATTKCGIAQKFWFISFCARAVMPAMSAKPPGIFPRAYVSTFSVTGPLTFLNTYKILSIAALRALLTVSAS